MNEQELQKTGVPWYRAEQWERLRERAADPEVIVDRYEDWIEQAEKMIALLAAHGCASRKPRSTATRWSPGASHRNVLLTRKPAPST